MAKEESARMIFSRIYYKHRENANRSLIPVFLNSFNPRRNSNNHFTAQEVIAAQEAVSKILNDSILLADYQKNRSLNSVNDLKKQEAWTGLFSSFTKTKKLITLTDDDGQFLLALDLAIKDILATICHHAKFLFSSSWEWFVHDDDVDSDFDDDEYIYFSARLKLKLTIKKIHVPQVDSFLNALVEFLPCLPPNNETLKALKAGQENLRKCTQTNQVFSRDIENIRDPNGGNIRNPKNHKFILDDQIQSLFNDWRDLLFRDDNGVVFQADERNYSEFMNFLQECVGENSNFDRKQIEVTLPGGNDIKRELTQKTLDSEKVKTKMNEYFRQQRQRILDSRSQSTISPSV